jgi:hypothetical protein
MGGQVEGWVAKLIGRLLFTASSLGSKFEPRHPSKIIKIINKQQKQRTGQKNNNETKLNIIDFCEENSNSNL